MFQFQLSNAIFWQKFCCVKCWFVQNIFRAGSGRFEKSHPDPNIDLPDPQSWFTEYGTVPVHNVIIATKSILGTSVVDPDP
jgi:hypothetical protein